MSTPIPSLSEALALIAGLPDEIPAHVISLLTWLRRSMESDGYTGISNESLALAMHVDLSTVKRAVHVGRNTWGFFSVVYTFKNGDRVTHSNEPPNSPHAPRGRYMGRQCEINWHGIKQLSDISRVPLGPQSEAESEVSFGGSNRASGREGNGQNEEPGTDFPRVPTPADTAPISVSAEDWNALIARMNEVFREVERRDGVKAPKDLVRGRAVERRLRTFIEAQEPAGTWSAYERVGNWFSLWVEHHALKKLRYPFSVFVREAPQFRSQLEDWESANPETRWREFPPEPPKPNLDDPNIKAITDLVYTLTKASAKRPLQESIWTVLQQHGVEKVKEAFEYAFSEFRAEPGNGSRDLRTRVREFFDGNHIEAVLAEKKHEEEERLERDRLERLYIVAERHADHVVFEPWYRSSRSRRQDVSLPANVSHPEYFVLGYQWELAEDRHWHRPAQQIPLVFQHQVDRLSALTAAQKKRDEKLAPVAAETATD